MRTVCVAYVQSQCYAPCLASQDLANGSCMTDDVSATTSANALGTASAAPGAARVPPTPMRSPRKLLSLQTPGRPRSFMMTPARKAGGGLPPVTPARTMPHPFTTPAAPTGTVNRPAPVPPVRRLVIHKLVLQDFKSYAGRQEIGPFHKSFSSIVGPNGSGKSNVIDALLFVFGWRANKMRQGRLSELIHNREGMEPPSQCKVEVWFREIIDYPDSESFDVVPGSRLILTRSALRNNSSLYHLNGKKSTYTEITSLLKERGIDLDHKRFLILQGEVESIAQMPPKAKTEHDEGLLEYLEDIIGTSSYKEPIEQHAKALDEANEARGEKMHRLKIVQRELDNLEPKRREAEQFVRDQNELTRHQSRLWQAHGARCTVQRTEASEALAAMEQRLATEREAHRDVQQAWDTLQDAHTAAAAACKDAQTQVQARSKELTQAEKHHVELTTRQKMLHTKQKKLQSSLSEAKAAGNEARAARDTAADDMTSAQRDLAAHETSLATEEASLAVICEKLNDKTHSIRQAIEQKQQELAPWMAKISEHTTARHVLQEERQWLASRTDEAHQRVEDARIALADMRQALQSKTEEVESLQYEQQTLADQMDSDQAQLTSMKAQEQTLRDKVAAARRAAEEARQALETSQSRSEVLRSLLRQSELGMLTGFHGRLGNLGTIDQRYDVAISTACPGLNNLVVDSVTTGQQCIEHLRKHKLGRANFVLLQSLQVSPKAMGPITTPENVPRLFDLVQPKEARFAPAFYHQLGDTLVAKDLQQANRIAYGAKRWRVVTEDGQLIDKSGTMSGGGTRVFRGAMSSTWQVDVTPEHAAKLAKEYAALEGEWRSHQQSLQQMQTMWEKQEERGPEIDHKLTMLDMDLRTSTQRIADAEQQLHELQGQCEPDPDDVKRTAEVDAELARHAKEIASLESESSEIQAAIHALQEQILEVGGVELRTQESKVAGIKEMMALCQERLAKAEEQHARASNECKRYEKTTETSETQLASLASDIATLASSLTEAQQGVEAARQAVEKARDALEEQDEAREKLQVQLDEKASALQAFRAMETDWQQQCDVHKKQVQDAEASRAQWQAQVDALHLHTIPTRAVGATTTAAAAPAPAEALEAMHEEPVSVKAEDEAARADPLPTLSHDEALAVDTAYAEAEIARLEMVLQKSQANLDVLEAFRQVEETYQARAQDVDATTQARDQAQQQFDALRKERLERFMQGFSQISLKLKEMYQTITLGGNAELELVDSLDPFSEGIIFSVMPPKKSWKNISNLSGGEKTLSSLALVFALHAYKPTPLYVMDEIDAALDFRNVSIIANIIKERTRGAQFVVISLRNNMFELSSRLVGVYKTHNCTKSITVANTDLHEGSAVAAPSPSKRTAVAATPAARYVSQDSAG